MQLITSLFRTKHMPHVLYVCLQCFNIFLRQMLITKCAVQTIGYGPSLVTRQGKRKGGSITYSTDQENMVNKIQCIYYVVYFVRLSMNPIDQLFVLLEQL